MFTTGQKFNFPSSPATLLRQVLRPLCRPGRAGAPLPPRTHAHPPPAHPSEGREENSRTPAYLILCCVMNKTLRDMQDCVWEAGHRVGVPPGANLSLRGHRAMSGTSVLVMTAVPLTLSGDQGCRSAPHGAPDTPPRRTAWPRCPRHQAGCRPAGLPPSQGTRGRVAVPGPLSLHVSAGPLLEGSKNRSSVFHFSVFIFF